MIAIFFNRLRVGTAAAVLGVVADMKDISSS